MHGPSTPASICSTYDTRGRLVRVEHVPALALLGVAAELRVAGDAPHVARRRRYFSARIFWARSASRRIAPLPKSCTRCWPSASTARHLVHAADDAFLAAGRHLGHLVVFVLERDVVDRRLAVFVQPLEAVEDDHRRFVGVGRVVGPHRREGDRVQQAVAVLMLQAFAVERGAAGRAAEHEALGPRSRPPPRSGRRSAGSRTSSSR